MALIAINAVVDIAGNVVVLEIVGIVSAMTTGTLEDGVVIGIGMASRAHVVRVAVIRREWRVLRMVKRGARPRRRVVTVLACGRKELRLRLVSRICCVVVVGLVAANAGDGQRRVIVIDVAVGADARRHQM